MLLLCRMIRSRSLKSLPPLRSAKSSSLDHMSRPLSLGGEEFVFIIVNHIFECRTPFTGTYLSVRQNQTASLGRFPACLPTSTTTSLPDLQTTHVGGTHPLALKTDFTKKNTSTHSTMSEQSEYVTLISSDGYSFIVQRSSACISGAIKRMLDPSCTLKQYQHPQPKSSS